MKSFTFAAAAAAVLAWTASAVDVDPIVISGTKFFYKTNGTQFFLRGVAYQQGIGPNTTQPSNGAYIDPLADSAACKRDIPYLTQLRTNTIRVYAVDPTQNHDDCMNALAAAGIYVVADLSQPNESINRNDPQWTTTLLKRYTDVVDVMATYTNTLGFFAGNEVSNELNNTVASAFVKAAVRDTKAYIKSKNYRTIGVGYATNDDAAIRVAMEQYFDCGDRASAIDFWGYNIYSWCGASNFKDSGYQVRTEEFKNYDVPVFFAEYGCNNVRPRLFTEVEALYGSQMTDVWSGGIVYMYFEEANEYGLVSISNNKVQTNADFSNLSKEIAKATPTGVQSSNYKPSHTAASCPSLGSSWNAVATPLPPVANAAACACMVDTLTCAVTDSVKEADYGDLFGFICGLKSGKYCAGIGRNATTGTYGAYGMCSAQEQLNFAVHQYALANPNGGCSFSGSATSKAVAKTTAASCTSLLQQAGTNGAGTVTSSPTGGAAQSTGASTGMATSHMENGLLTMGVYVFGAALSGMAMILL
ncbi:carbohydrate-binding module family 43 protein [Pleomassaria siparia CBS 279.74]|uniref:1,3-beta-glucanosyltransferase n=1 Tax=Pleomassaria siparia CBS 279.74 TaxID=1314801 RepID=A0A6G1JQP8_9PLEO|nr:carbohydrate-binding module family 43 protein [Pleomassaria siparia CBS 279.74]